MRALLNLLSASWICTQQKDPPKRAVLSSAFPIGHKHCQGASLARMPPTVATLKSGAVFTAPIVARVAHMALPISCFIRVEVVERMLSAIRHGSYVAVMR